MLTKYVVSMKHTTGWNYEIHLFVFWNTEIYIFRLRKQFLEYTVQIECTISSYIFMQSYTFITKTFTI